MKFSLFADYLLKLEGTASRLAMTEQLAALFKALAENEIQPACYLMQGQLVPQYQSLEFQMSVKMVIKALAKMSGQSEATITQTYKKLGDIGLVAESLSTGNADQADLFSAQAATQPPADVSIQAVFSALEVIAHYSGAGSQEQKTVGLAELLAKVDHVSARYVARIVVGKLRLGFATMTLMDSLSWAVVGDKSETDQLELIYQKRADIGILAKNYLHYRKLSPAERLQKLDAETQVTIGIPVVPALCQRLNSSEEIIAKMNEVIVEPKYDGLRVQIHFDKQATDGKKIQVFTRNLENVTPMFPELATVFDRIKATNCVLDAEAIGYNKDTGKLLPFQETITRRRKHDVGEKAGEVPIRFYVFDVLLLDDESFLAIPLRVRKERLSKLFNDNEVFVHAPIVITDSAEKTRTLHHRFLAEGLEGAVMKQVDSHYVGGRKGWNWVKIKEAEGTTGKLSDTLDCIVMGYYSGRGKRNAFGMGALLVGVLDTASQQVLTIAKIGTGLSDEQLQSLKQECDQQAVKEKPAAYQVVDALVPDVWVKPALVLEIAADELTNSPNHTAKLAMRFPRLISVRRDKSWEQATTLEELAGIKIAV